MSGISFARGSTSVSGPGQNAFANLSALSGQSLTQRFAISRLDDVNDDGIVRRPAFDPENFCDRLSIQRIGGQAINRFRRQRNHFAGTQQVRRAGYGGLEKARACAWTGIQPSHAIHSVTLQSGRAWKLSRRDKIRK